MILTLDQLTALYEGLEIMPHLGGRDCRRCDFIGEADKGIVLALVPGMGSSNAMRDPR